MSSSKEMSAICKMLSRSIKAQGGRRGHVRRGTLRVPLLKAKITEQQFQLGAEFAQACRERH